MDAILRQLSEGVCSWLLGGMSKHEHGFELHLVGEAEPLTQELSSVE